MKLNHSSVPHEQTHNLIPSPCVVSNSIHRTLQLAHQDSDRTHARMPRRKPCLSDVANMVKVHRRGYSLIAVRCRLSDYVCTALALTSRPPLARFSQHRGHLAAELHDVPAAIPLGVDCQLTPVETLFHVHVLEHFHQDRLAHSTIGQAYLKRPRKTPLLREKR